jgi:hypothetical protein
MKRLLRARTWVATIVVTSLTLVLVGGVVLATTKLGCSPTNQLGMKLAQCVPTRNTAARTSPVPIYKAYPSAGSGGTPSAPSGNPVSSYPPDQGTTTSYPPPQGGTISSSGQIPQAPFYSSASGPSAPNLTCTLPVFAGPPGSGGFVSFPGGGFTADPRSAVAIPSPGPVQGPGYGNGSIGMTYDRSHSRWLPVPNQLVSPDGNHYAYASSSGVYVVQASNNAEVEVGEGHMWYPLRALDDRVFAVVQGAPGLWVLPFSGTPTQVITTGYWQAATASFAYGTTTSAVPAGSTQTMQQLDIATGKVSDWFSLNGASVGVSGFDLQGHPLISATYSSGAWELWLTTSATNDVLIANSFEQIYMQGPPFGDSHGIWLSLYMQGYPSGPVLALYVPGAGIFGLAQVGAQLAGPCA